jgi:hypothetical protein
VIMLVRLRHQRDPYRYSVKLCAIFLLIALLQGSSFAHAASLDGYWYGKGYQPFARKTVQWLAIRRSDGSYSVEFREYSNCRVVFAQLETGRWAVSGDVITDKTLTVNGWPVRDTPYYTDTYKIIELDDSKMRIVHEKTGQDWMLDRVTEDFIFPDCKNVS